MIHTHEEPQGSLLSISCSSSSSSDSEEENGVRQLLVDLFNVVLTALQMETCMSPREGEMRILNFIREQAGIGQIDSLETSQ